jgi:hypothetical protein
LFLSQSNPLLNKDTAMKKPYIDSLKATSLQLIIIIITIKQMCIHIFSL